MVPEGSPAYAALLRAGYRLQSCPSNAVCSMVLEGSPGPSSQGCARIAVPVDWPMRIIPLPGGARGARIALPGLELPGRRKVVLREPSKLEVIGSGAIEPCGSMLCVDLELTAEVYSSWALLDYGEGREEVVAAARLAASLSPQLIYVFRGYTVEPWISMNAARLMPGTPLLDPLGLLSPPAFRDPSEACRASLGS